jgi:hypothetical protein
VNVLTVSLLNESEMGVLKPPPEGVTVTVPVNGALIVTVKFVEAVFRAPPLGPVKVYVAATTDVEALEQFVVVHEELGVVGVEPDPSDAEA